MERSRKFRQGALTVGVALTGFLIASSAARAQCTVTGPLAQFGNLLPFAAGGSVNSLVSVLNTINTAYLTQTTAFIGSPEDRKPNDMGGGVWARGIGGRVDTDSVGTTNVSAAAGGPVPGNITCNTQTRQNYAGYQAGADISRLNVGEWNFHIGGTAGYLESNATDVSPGGTFSANIQVPFVGIYAAATRGGFFVDGQVRWDFLQNKVTDPANGLFGQQFDARSTSLSGNIGYNYGVNSWYIEPSAGIVWSHTTVDPLNIIGTAVIGSGLAPPGTVRVGDIESILGRLGVRVGTTFTGGDLILSPFVTANLFHEFAGNVTTTLATNFTTLFNGLPPGVQEANATLSTSRIGTYGQFSLGMSAQQMNSNWLGYARVDFRHGDNIDGIGVNGGLRYQFAPEKVVTAGVKPVYKAPPMAPAAYSWSGFYVGGYAGSLFGESTGWLESGTNFRLDRNRYAGVLAGGQAGVNLQVNSWVFGIEGDMGGSNANGAVSCPGSAAVQIVPFLYTCRNEVEWLATVTGRVGYAYERALIYAKGGMAAGAVRVETSFNGANNVLTGIATPPATGPVNGTTKTSLGWTVGGGVEFALNRNWSAKAEYMYFDLGKNQYAVDPPFIEDVSSVHGSLVRIGVNYRFTGLPM